MGAKSRRTKREIRDHDKRVLELLDRAEEYINVAISERPGVAYQLDRVLESHNLIRRMALASLREGET